MSRDYIAWLNGCSVHQGTLAEVRARAREIFETPLWQEHNDKPTTCRITKGITRQSFVESIIWHPLTEETK